MLNKESQSETKVDSSITDKVPTSSPNAAKPNVGGSFIVLSYLIYIIIYELIIILGCGYIVFVLNRSGWWWLLAVLFSSGAYTPERWNALLTGKEQPKS